MDYFHAKIAYIRMSGWMMCERNLGKDTGDRFASEKRTQEPQKSLVKIKLIFIALYKESTLRSIIPGW